MKHIIRHGHDINESNLDTWQLGYNISDKGLYLKTDEGLVSFNQGVDNFFERIFFYKSNLINLSGTMQTNEPGASGWLNTDHSTTTAAARDILNNIENGNGDMIRPIGTYFYKSFGRVKVALIVNKTSTNYIAYNTFMKFEKNIKFVESFTVYYNTHSTVQHKIYNEQQNINNWIGLDYDANIWWNEYKYNKIIFTDGQEFHMGICYENWPSAVDGNILNISSISEIPFKFFGVMQTEPYKDVFLNKPA